MRNPIKTLCVCRILIVWLDSQGGEEPSYTQPQPDSAFRHFFRNQTAKWKNDKQKRRKSAQNWVIFNWYDSIKLRSMRMNLSLFKEWFSFSFFYFLIWSWYTICCVFGSILHLLNLLSPQQADWSSWANRWTAADLIKCIISIGQLMFFWPETVWKLKHKFYKILLCLSSNWFF